MTLAERIHRACPCLKVRACSDDCHCIDHSRNTLCKWEGHAIAGEVQTFQDEARKDVADLHGRIQALTAKVESGHDQGCRCHELEGTITHKRAEWSFKGHAHPYVDPRCVEWRKS